MTTPELPASPEAESTPRQIEVEMTPEEWNRIHWAFIKDTEWKPDADNPTKSREITLEGFNELLANHRDKLLEKDDNGELPEDQKNKGLAAFEELQANGIISKEPLDKEKGIFQARAPRTIKKSPHIGYGSDSGPTRWKRFTSRMKDETHARYGKDGVLEHSTVGALKHAVEKRNEPKRRAAEQDKAQQAATARADWNKTRQTKLTLGYNPESRDAERKRNTPYDPDPDPYARMMARQRNSGGSAMPEEMMAMFAQMMEAMANNSGAPASDTTGRSERRAPLTLVPEASKKPDEEELSGKFGEDDLAALNTDYRSAMRGARIKRGLAPGERMSKDEFSEMSNRVIDEVINYHMGEDFSEEDRRTLWRDMWLYAQKNK